MLRATCRTSALFACLRAPRHPDAVFAIARDFSPRIQRYGASSIVLDVSGLGRLLGDADAIAAELHREARERSKGIHVAVAPTQTAALLLAYAQTACLPHPVVAADDVGGTLAPLPLAALRQLVEDAYGCPAAMHERTFDVLRRWGLTTIGEFVALPPIELSQRVGQRGVALQRLAAGIDPSPLTPDPGVPRFVQAMELEWPIEELEPLAFVLARLLDPLAAALERADRGAAAIRLDLRLADRTVHSRVLQLPAAMRDPRVLRTLLLLDLESHAPRAAIDIVTIEVDPAPARIIQYSLLERARPSAETLATLTARLNALVGETRCGAPVLRESHGPDAFEMRRFAPGEPGLGAEARSAKAAGLGASYMTDDRPVIGVTRCSKLPDYLASVEQAGGEPRVLEVSETPDDALRQIDGLLLTGGGDVNPALYGEPRHEAVEDAEPGRDQFELALARRALASDVPTLAICRGAQVLNVAAGGTLVQDIPSTVDSPLSHSVAEHGVAHPVKVTPGSRLHDALGSAVDAGGLCRVNSRHHQSVARVGESLVPSAYSDDGVIEAIERPDATFCLGVQWHPENFCRTGEFNSLFERFVAAARDRLR